MKMRKLLRTLLVIALVIFMLTGCTKHLDPNGEGFNAGETLTPEELDRLSSQIFTASETARPFDNIFYWTENGSKVHLFSDCGHLKNSSDICSGDENAVRSLKKSGMCASCLKVANKAETDFDFFDANTTTSAVPNTEAPRPSYSINSDTLFYWTESGSKYHLYRDCSYLKNAVNILSADKTELDESEKDGPCSACLKKAGLTLEEFLELLK